MRYSYGAWRPSLLVSFTRTRTHHTLTLAGRVFIHLYTVFSFLVARLGKLDNARRPICTAMLIIILIYVYCPYAFDAEGSVTVTVGNCRRFRSAHRTAQLSIDTSIYLTAWSSTMNVDLSLYELHRKPHETIMDNTTIAVSPRALHSELMCPICLDLMRNTQTTKECLHRFCQDCIITALRSGNKECPTCRKKLVSKRSLRADPNFDRLIEKIYANRNELSSQQEKSIPRVCTPTANLQSRKRKATDSPVSADDDHAPELKRSAPMDVSSIEQDIGDSASSATPVPTPPPASSQETKTTPTEIEEIELQIRPHPRERVMEDFAIRNLSTTPDATVSHLVKYLTLYQIQKDDRPNTDVVRASDFDSTKEMTAKCTLYMQFSNNGEEDFTILPSGTSLRQICDNYWTPGEKLKLYFSLDGAMSS